MESVFQGQDQVWRRERPIRHAQWGVLINNLGITETRELNEIEQDLLALSLKELAQEALPETFNFAHLRHLHKRIFDRVYPWAGELPKGEPHAHEMKSGTRARLNGIGCCDRNLKPVSMWFKEGREGGADFRARGKALAAMPSQEGHFSGEALPKNNL